MEKVNKLPYCPSQCTEGISSINKFYTPNLSPSSSSRKPFRSRLQLKPQSITNRKTDNLTNDTERNYLMVKKEPLRSIQDKHLKVPEFIDPSCHKHDSMRTNYFEEGKILHRDVDWITHNIANCMVTLWVKNQKNFQLLHQHFNSTTELKLDCNFHNIKQPDEQTEITTIPKNNHSIEKVEKSKSNFAKMYLNHANTRFSNLISSNPANEQKEIQHIVQLIFKGKNKLSMESDKSPHPFKLLKGQKSTSVEIIQNPKYKFSVQDDHNQIINQITSRNQQLYPFLLDFSRKILMQKQKQLIEKLLKNEKLNNLYLDSLGIKEKVKVFQNILIKRMEDFSVLKEKFWKVSKKTSIELQQQKKIISQLMSKGLFKHQPRKLLSKDSRLNKLNSFLDVKTISMKQSNFHHNKQNYPGFRNSQKFDNRDSYLGNQNDPGLKNVHIQFNQIFANNDDMKLKKNDLYKRNNHSKDRVSLPNFQENFELNEQIDRKPQKIFIKSIKSIKNLHQTERPSEKNIKSTLNTKKQLIREKTFESDGKKTNKNIKYKDVKILAFNKDFNQQPKQQKNLQQHKIHESQPLKNSERNHLNKSSAKKRLDGTLTPKRKLFLKNKRKGIQFSPLTTKQFLKFLRAKNKAKFLEIQNESQKYTHEEKERIKYATVDNSPIKNKAQISNFGQKVKHTINFNLRKEKKEPERRNYKKTQKRKTFKSKQSNLSPVPIQIPTKTVSKIKRLKFQSNVIIPHKFIEKILHQRPYIDKEKDTYVLRDKLVANFNRLLQTGLLDHGQLAKYKEEVQSLIRSYDQTRRTTNVKKSVLSTEKIPQSQKPNCNQCPFNINVKIRNDDPFIFERLRDVHQALKQNQKSSMFQTPLINNQALASQLKEFKQNQRAERRNSNVEFDLEFYDFFSPAKTKYEDQDGIDDEISMRDSIDDEQSMIDFMKKFIQESWSLAQKEI